MAAVTIPEFVNFMSVLIVSTACHEAAHARLADRFGDDTPRMAGRISWNPFVHVHPIYTIALPAILFWTTGSYISAAFTPVNPSKMRNPRLHSLLVALGGPAMNLVLALVFFAALAGFVLAIGGYGPESLDREKNVLEVLFLGVHLNLFLACFNMLPVPPLDGSDLVGFLLPPRWHRHWVDLRRHAWLLFALLLLTGVLDKVLGPATRASGRVVAEALDVVNRFARG